MDGGLAALYRKAMTDKSDIRTSSWLMVGSPGYLLAIIAVYLGLVIKGPQLMESFTPVKLKKTLIVYNFVLVLVNAFIAYKTLAFTLGRSDFSLSCQAVSYDTNRKDTQLAEAIWWFYFSKIIELLDTIFFILRKKFEQVTFLHVYHHTAMPLLWWMCVRFIAGGSTYFSVAINSIVHVIMYTYYMMAACGPEVRKYLWWKRYLTVVQLVQFVTVILHSLNVIYQNCGYPAPYMVLNSTYLASLFVLFLNFYMKSYKVKSKQ